MVGYILAGIKTVSDTRIGDTITQDANPAARPLPGFKEVKPVVFASIFPVGADDYQSLTESLEKYKLNDAALIYQKDASAALGLGFRCGFLGLLHLEIVQERLEREFDQSIIMTVPGVRYRFTLADGREITVDNPMHYPDPSSIKGSAEPFIRAHILIPERFVGAVMKLCLERRGVNSSYNYPSPSRVEITFEMPLAGRLHGEVVKIAHPSPVHAAGHVARERRVHVAVAQHHGPGFQQRQDAALGPVGEIGRVDQGESGGRQHLLFLAELRGVLHERG